MSGKFRNTGLFKLLIALALLVTPLLGSVTSAAAQDTGLVDDSTFVSELTDEEITWSSDWEAGEDAAGSGDGFESITLSSDSGIVQIAYIEVSGDPESVLTDYIEGFTTSLGTIDNVDSDELADGWYSLDELVGDDVAASVFGVLTELDDVSRLVIVLSPPANVSDAVDSVKSDIEFDGDDGLAGIDAVTESDVTLAEASTSDDDDETPVADDEEDTTPEADDEETPEVTLTTDETPDADDEETPEDDDSNEESGNSYTFEINDAVVEWEAPWELDDSLNIIEDNYESVGFIGDQGIQSVLYMPTGVDLIEARDAFLEGFASEDVQIQEIDRGAYDNVSYSLDLAEIDGELWGLFTVYIDDGEYVLSYATLSPAEVLGASVDQAKESITINGEAIYNGVTGPGLQDLIDANIDNFAPTDTVEGGADDKETPESTDDGDESGNDADADEYLATVRESYDELVASEDRFDELLSGGDLSDADFQEITGILDLWTTSAEAAGSLDVPEGFEDLQKIYEEYTEALSDAGVNFISGLTAEADSDEQADFLATYQSDRINADEYSVMLEELLSDAGV